MRDDLHYTPDRLLDEMETNPAGVRAHVRSCQACSFVLALVRRLRREPTEEESEVVLDLLGGAE